MEVIAKTLRSYYEVPAEGVVERFRAFPTPPFRRYWRKKVTHEHIEVAERASERFTPLGWSPGQPTGLFLPGGG